MSKSTYTLKIKTKAVDAAAKRAFVETAFLLGRQFTQVITEPRHWEGFDYRDIVDDGQLRSSQQVVFTGDFEATYSWPVEYAAPVHEGYTTRSDQKVEGRPWTAIALREFDVQATYLALYQRYLEGI